MAQLAGVCISDTSVTDGLGQTGKILRIEPLAHLAGRPCDNIFRVVITSEIYNVPGNDCAATAFLVQLQQYPFYGSACVEAVKHALGLLYSDHFCLDLL